MLLFMNIDYRKLRKWILPAFIGVTILLLITPIIGVNKNNATSWIALGSFTIQPAEFAKLAVVIYVANLLSKKLEIVSDFKKGFIPPVAVVLFISALIMLQPDFGSTAILVSSTMIVIFVAGARIRHFAVTAAIGAFFITIVYAMNTILNGGENDYRVNRITTYLNPWSDPQGNGYQIIQSLYALGHGRVTGAGLGQSIQKLNYLPLPYNDFIFSVIGEELGFIGGSFFLLIYLAFIWRCIIVALRSKELFGTLIGVGIASIIGIQAFINMGGVTNTIPMTGVTLPLISYGGSSMMVTLLGMGILLSISRDRTKSETQSNKKSTNSKNSSSVRMITNGRVP